MKSRERITLSKAVGHFRTIKHHHDLVCSYCIRAGLIWQGLTHDLSKLSPAEFLVGARYYQGDRSDETLNNTLKLKNNDLTNFSNN